MGAALVWHRHNTAFPAFPQVLDMLRQIKGPRIVIERDNPFRTLVFGFERIKPVHGANVEHSFPTQIWQAKSLKLVLQVTRGLVAARGDSVAEVEGVKPERHGRHHRF
jgi:hypothetical protein